MKNSHVLYIITLLFAVLAGCVEDPVMPDDIKLAKIPEVTTYDPMPINATSFEASGKVIKENGADVIRRGFYLGKHNPVTRENKLLQSENKEGEDGGFKHIFTELINTERYYFAAYAENIAGESIGETFAVSTPFTDAAVFSGAPRTPGSAAYSTIAGNAYLFGGDLGTKPTDELWMFNPNTGFTSRRVAPEALLWSSAVSYDQALFVLGGEDFNYQLTDAFYQYVTTTNTWNKIEGSLIAPSAVARTVACRANMHLYFIGGIRNNANKEEYVSKEVWMFDPYLRSWTHIADFPDVQYGGIAVYYDNIMYAGLGIKSLTYPYTYSRDLYGYNPGNDSWSLVTSFPEGGALAGTLLDNCLYVVDTSGYIWCYDFDANSWTRKSRLGLENRDIHCIYTLNDRIYMGFGSNSNKLICYDPAWDNHLE